jgi:hypothetical protein
MGNARTVYRILVGNLHERPIREANIKVNLRGL